MQILCRLQWESIWGVHLQNLNDPAKGQTAAKSTAVNEYAMSLRLILKAIFYSFKGPVDRWTPINQLIC